MKITDITLDKNGLLPSHAWPGGYPIFYLDRDCEVLCPSCANIFKDHNYSRNRPTHWEVHYEGPSLSCDECNEEVESAYGDPDADEEEESLDRYVTELERTYIAKEGK